MRSFFDLAGFEYKKIFKRKGAVIALIIITVFTIISPVLGLFIGNVYIDGEFFETNYQAMAKDRDYARALSGRYIDEILLSEAKEAYSKIPPVDSNLSYVGVSEYQKYGRPYSDIYGIVYSVLGSDFRLLQNLQKEQMQNFYQIRHDRMANEINAMNISDKSKEKLIQLDSEIKTPWVFSYIGGYESFVALLYSTGVFAAFAISICLAPMFAGEYGTRTDQLILSSKFGKNKIIAAKLFTGVSFCGGLSVALTVILYLVVGITYGFDGANAPIQLFYPSIIYPMTILQGAVVCTVCLLFAEILIGGITLLLSSIFKSPFGVIIIMSMLIFIPMMLNVSGNSVLILNLFRLLPTNMVWVAMSLIDYTPYELFGLTIPPYIFIPVFAALTTILILPFAHRSFKNHQIG